MYTHWQIQHLKHGHDFGDGFCGAHGLLHPDGAGWIQAGACWDIMANQIVREWIQQPPRPGSHGGAGSRPAGWWWFSSRERRRRLNGIHPFDNTARTEHIERLKISQLRALRLFFGVPSCLCVPADFTALYETEAEYLDRLGLWLPGERELWEAT